MNAYRQAQAQLAYTVRKIQNANAKVQLASAADAPGEYKAQLANCKSDLAKLEAEKERVEDEVKKAEGEVLSLQGGGVMLREEVTDADVATVVSRWTGVPVAKLVSSEKQKLLQLESELHERVIGQEEAVTCVAEAVQRSRADLADPNGPVASFMFLGPTGV